MGEGRKGSTLSQQHTFTMFFLRIVKSIDSIVHALVSDKIFFLNIDVCRRTDVYVCVSELYLHFFLSFLLFY